MCNVISFSSQNHYWTCRLDSYSFVGGRVLKLTLDRKSHGSRGSVTIWLLMEVAPPKQRKMKSFIFGCYSFIFLLLPRWQSLQVTKRKEKWDEVPSVERRWWIIHWPWTLKRLVVFFYSSCVARKNITKVFLISSHLKAINGSSYTYVTLAIQISWLFKILTQLKGNREYLESLNGDRMARILFPLEKNVFRHFYKICWKEAS